MHDKQTPLSWHRLAGDRLFIPSERGAAGTYHQMGRVAEERGDFEAAEDEQAVGTAKQSLGRLMSPSDGDAGD